MFLGYFSTGRFQDHGSSMVQVGSLTYFVPDMADAVGVFEAATREYTQVDTWRNNPNTTMDLPWIFHGSSMDLPWTFRDHIQPWPIPGRTGRCTKDGWLGWLIIGRPSLPHDWYRLVLVSWGSSWNPHIILGLAATESASHHLFGDVWDTILIRISHPCGHVVRYVALISGHSQQDLHGF